MFYLTTHSTHFIYGYMASNIWLRTILIVRKETRCRHIGYSFRLTARVILYAPSHRQDSTYHGLCYTSRGALAGTRNSSMGPPHEGSIRRPTAPWANVLTTELHLAPSIIWRRTYGRGPLSANKTPPPLLHRLFFPTSSKGSFVWIIPQTGYHIAQSFFKIYLPFVEHWLYGIIAHSVHYEGLIQRRIAPWAGALSHGDTSLAPPPPPPQYVNW